MVPTKSSPEQSMPNCFVGPHKPPTQDVSTPIGQYSRGKKNGDGAMGRRERMPTWSDWDRKPVRRVSEAVFSVVPGLPRARCKTGETRYGYTYTGIADKSGPVYMQDAIVFTFALLVANPMTSRPLAPGPF